jgi:uncharacterized protein YggE
MPNARLSALAFFCCLLLTPALAQTPGSRPTAQITIAGQGTATAVPDQATITIGVITQARTAREALTANTAAMNEATQAIKQAGVADRDLQTSGFTVEPQFRNERGQPPRIGGYIVANELTVRVRDLTRLGDVLDRAVSTGSNTITGPVFGLADPDAARDVARRAAAADAQRRARLYAEALGVRLGRVLNVTDHVTPSPRPMVARSAMTADAVPIQAGETTIAATVTIAWEIDQ